MMSPCILFLLLCLFSSTTHAAAPPQTADLRLINSCNVPLWFEARYGPKGIPLPGQSGTHLYAAASTFIDYVIPDTGLDSTRFWAKYGCNSNGTECIMGDQAQYWPDGGCPTTGCTAPIDSLFEATFGCKPGSSCAKSNPLTWFDVSQVDGWTIPYKLTVNGASQQCDVNAGFKGVDASHLDVSRCPQGDNLAVQGFTTTPSGTSLKSVDLRLIDQRSQMVVGCMSPCRRMSGPQPWGMGQPEDSGAALWMCCPTPLPDSACTPAAGCVTAAACRAGGIDSTQYVNAVHNMAPDVYAYSYDDGIGLHTCPAGTVIYTMEFCPPGSAAYPAPVSSSRGWSITTVNSSLPSSPGTTSVSSPSRSSLSSIVNANLNSSRYPPTVEISLRSHAMILKAPLSLLVLLILVI